MADDVASKTDYITISDETIYLLFAKKFGNSFGEGIFKCPEDKLPLDYAKIFPDPAAEQQILSNMVRCSNAADGCKWTDELKNLNGHLEVCRFSHMPCPNHCSELVGKMCLQDHLEFACSKRKLPCEFCGRDFSGENMDAHEGNCSHEVVWCENKCGAKLQRRFLANHMRNECHKRTSICQFCSKEFVFETIQTHQYSCPRFPISCPNRCQVNRVPREEIEIHLHESCPSTVISCPFRDYGCTIKCPRYNLDKHLEDSSKKHLSHMCRVVQRQQSQIVTLRSKVDSMTQVTDGVLIWKISDFKVQTLEAKSKPGLEIVSEPFYSSRYGYRLVASSFLNGNGSGEGKYLSLYIKLLPGEYDNILEWPFCLPMSFTLLDQNPIPEARVHVRESFVPDPTWKHFQKPDSEETSLGFGYPKYISLETLKTRNYIKDDAIFIRIKVDARAMTPF